MNATEEPIQTLIIEQASEWYARHRDGDLTPPERDAFMSWLQTSPLHVREYLAAAAVAERLPLAVARLDMDRQNLLGRARHWLRSNSNVIALRSVSAKSSVTKPIPERRLSARQKWIAGLGALVLLSATAYWSSAPPGLSGWSRALEVPRGEQRTVQLRDGSVLHLNADTRVRVRYSGTQRLIELEHGQVLFNVAHQNARPFVVRAGTTDVVAVGTQFDVLKRSTRDAVTVTVVEGEVAVFEHEHRRVSGEATQTDRTSSSVQLIAGQRLRLDPALAHPLAEAVDARAATAWLRRELIFSEERLADVAEEFSRYGVPIEIKDSALRDYRISGVFNTYDTESFVAYLRRFGEVEQAGQGIRVHGARLPPQAQK